MRTAFRTSGVRHIDQFVPLRSTGPARGTRSMSVLMPGGEGGNPLSPARPHRGRAGERGFLADFFGGFAKSREYGARGGVGRGSDARQRDAKGSGTPARTPEWRGEILGEEENWQHEAGRGMETPRVGAAGTRPVYI